MSWLKEQVTIYNCAADNLGRVVTWHSVLRTLFAVPHDWFYKINSGDLSPEEKLIYPKGKWIKGFSNDFHAMREMRTSDIEPARKTLLKQTMQCMTPAAVMPCKKKGAIHLDRPTGFMQVDFDYNDIKDYYIDELKRAVASLPFVAYCGLSVSGKGFWALVRIAEPEKLEKYAEHCFRVFEDYGIKPDSSKGRNLNDLRFLSYDADPFYNLSPEPLKISRFKPFKEVKPSDRQTIRPYKKSGSNTLVICKLNMLSNAIVGGRWATVQNVAFTLGGLGEHSILEEIKYVIRNTVAFNGEETKYCQVADDCFKAGMQKPLA